MAAYYNEIDPQAAQWLRNLIAAGLIAPGDVDERSVWDVHPGDLEPYIQCHFFAGVGVWSHALRGAGWADDRPVWTGSCPCQPFSQAGKGRAQADDRHHWPAWAHLIRERRPSRIFGEQVESPDGIAWLDAVQTDLEALGYAFGPLVLPAAGFGAPHGRHRTFFVADAECWPAERHRHNLAAAPIGTQRKVRQQRVRPDAGAGGATGAMADADGGLAGDRELQPRGQHGQQPEDGRVGIVGDAHNPGREGWLEHWDGTHQWVAGAAGVVGGAWSNTRWIGCSDGRLRPVEPGTFPLVDGAPSRLVRIRAYGNAIVAPVAEEFIRAYMNNAPSQRTFREEK